MTTIAAVRTANGIVMGGDTAAASNDGRVWPVTTKLEMLGPVDDRAVVGHSGHRMVVPALRALGAPTADPDADEHQLDVAAQQWADDLAEALRERRIPTCDDGLIDGIQLLAWRDRLWMCTDGLADPLAAEHTAVGSGGDLALGYLDAALSRLSPPHYCADDALREAIRCAARHDTCTAGEPHVLYLDPKGAVVDAWGEPL